MNGKLTLLSPEARIQVPWVKVVIGPYTFGVFSKSKSSKKDENGSYYTEYNVVYPNYIQSLNINKINGQVNQYTLSITYPVRPQDDPNFFEKVFSSVSKTRKIIFSYGDMSMPTYVYKDEEALITKVTQNFDLRNGTINYTIEAVSTATLNSSGSFTFVGTYEKPSDVIKKVFNNPKYGLQKLFTGMNAGNIDKLIDGEDKPVKIDTKTNIAPIDYINYLVSCMIPAGNSGVDVKTTDVYILTLHDDTTYDRIYNTTSFTIPGDTGFTNITGPFFRVEKVSHKVDRPDALNIDIGFGNSGMVVTNFSIVDNQNYSLMYDYQGNLGEDPYVRRITNNGTIEEVYSPAILSKNERFTARAEDLVWWTKVTQYPIKATITILGLLRAATLMNYVRLNVIFPGGNKHISSGLYLITKQQDTIDANGYRTQLSLTRVAGDSNLN